MNNNTFQNYGLKIFLTILLLFIAISLAVYPYDTKLANFIVTTLTAIGTCGVTILTVFPFTPADKLRSEIYRRTPDGTIIIKITNLTKHTIYLGSDRHSTLPCPEDYAMWWPSDGICAPDNANSIYAEPFDNLAVPPQSSIFYSIDERIFNDCDIKKIKIQIRTSSGARFDVTNKL